MMCNLLSRVLVVSCLYWLSLLSRTHAAQPAQDVAKHSIDATKLPKANAGVNAKPDAVAVVESTVIKVIHTVEDFMRIGVDPLFPLSGSYRLDHDLDFQNAVFDGIGSQDAPFTGHFNGNGYCIKGLSITANRDYTGLFRMIGKEGSVVDLVIDADQVQGKAYTGSLAGYSQGTIKNCVIKGHVNGSNNVGGMVGINGKYGQIHASKMCGKVKGSRYEIGGLVGCNLGLIMDSEADVIVTGIRVVGGLVGMNDETGRIKDCLVKVEVAGQYFVGGLVGHNWFRGVINHCIAQADVIGEEYVGGLAGANYDQALITKSSSMGRVQGIKHVGKFLGSNRGKVNYGLTMQDKWRKGLQG